MIDFNFCNAFDVIDRSIAMHPSLLRDSILAVSTAHHSYAQRCYHKDTRDNCFRYIKENALTVRAIGNGKSAREACTTFHRVIETFNIACRLQLIPERCRAGIIARTEMPKA